MPFPSLFFRYYGIMGLVALGIFGYVERYGWGLLDSDKINNVPKTVRENPGVYRSHYNFARRSYGGK